MNKLAVVLFFTLSITNAQIQDDKKLHFAAGAIASGIGYEYVYSKTQNKEQALAAGILTSIAAGIGKEIYDSLQKKNQFDQHDVAATVLGGVSFSIVIKLDAINFGSEAKRKKKKRKKQKNEK
jgi:putative lipoprotein